MIRIDNYSSIAFAQWIRNRKHLYNITNLNGHQISELVERYLRENVGKWDLKFFLKLFQDYTIRLDGMITKSSDLNVAFKNFCTSTNSLEFIDPNSIDKKVYLYPLLYEFSYFAKVPALNYINEGIKQFAYSSFENQEGILEWFKCVTEAYGEELVSLFTVYMEEVLDYDLGLFLSWIYRKKRSEVYYEKTNYYELSFNKRKYQIIEKINDGTVDKDIVRSIHNRGRGNDILASIAVTEDYSELDFIYYLEKKSINIFKEIPKEMLERLADEYTNEFPNANKKKTYSFISKMRGDKSFLNMFMNIFKNKYGNEFRFERYISCKYHGVFLFRKNDNLSKFLKDFWEDIHHGTGNTLDFYFTDKDFNRDYHCKQWINKYANMEIDVKEFPSIFLWNINGSDREYILLKGLTHKEIFEVIEYLTSQLEATDFSKSILATNIKVKEMIDAKKISQNVYIANNSQIGAFGEHATSDNNNFNK